MLPDDGSGRNERSDAELVGRAGETLVPDEDEARQLVAAIDATTVVGLRDQTTIGLMADSFAWVGTLIAMNVEDYYTQGK